MSKPQPPGLQYPHTTGNPEADNTIKMVIDNLFYLRGIVNQNAIAIPAGSHSVYERSAILLGNFVFGGGGYFIQDAGFSVVPISSGGTGAQNASAARQALGAAASSGVGAHTITLAKITGGGANGSITWDNDGVITAWVDPT